MHNLNRLFYVNIILFRPILFMKDILTGCREFSIHLFNPSRYLYFINILDGVPQNFKILNWKVFLYI